MSELRYLREVWLKRAEVAKECAGELEGLRAKLDGVVTRNYFGDGCLEGIELFERLQLLVKSGSQDLGVARDSALDLGAASAAASDSIESADANAIR
ncbi:hypothetical protein [Gordonia sp. (in: high G+C Gram-positive bacteria)]|uniref:hypothetical protein n=1 Tax=Gordonia sp. (in: high G+C Gram-positive bacteria) TaxID=84139 RepID=UPI003C716DED